MVISDIVRKVISVLCLEIRMSNRKKIVPLDKRKLIADKEIFRLWYEYYKLVLKSDDKEIQKALKKSAAFYLEWGTDANVHFDDWWITHQHMFKDDDKVKLVTSGEKKDENHLFISVPKGRPIELILEEFTAILKTEFKDRQKRLQLPFHKYSPTEIQGFKRETTRLHLELQKYVFNDTSLKGELLFQRVMKFFSGERFKRKPNEVPEPFQYDKLAVGDNQFAQRNIRRYRQRSRNILMNVAKGVFPGKY